MYVGHPFTLRPMPGPPAFASSRLFIEIGPPIGLAAHVVLPLVGQLDYF